MRLLKRLLAYPRLIRTARRNRTDALPYLGRRPLIATAIGVYEAAVLLNNAVDPRTKYLATTRTASLVGCPF
jgi:hypothetical protein